MKKIHNLYELVERRRELRKRSTKYEMLLWFEIRNRKLGVKFKRQHSLGYYITDFYCPEKKLVIELDGEYHDTIETKEYDNYRDTILQGMECTVLRIKNSEIESNIDSVLSKIYNALTLSREERAG